MSFFSSCHTFPIEGRHSRNLHTRPASSMKCAVYGFLYWVCSIECSVCRVKCLLFSELCLVPCAVCSVQCSLLRMSQTFSFISDQKFDDRRPFGQRSALLPLYCLLLVRLDWQQDLARDCNT